MVAVSYRLFPEMVHPVLLLSILMPVVAEILFKTSKKLLLLMISPLFSLPAVPSE